MCGLLDRSGGRPWNGFLGDLFPFHREPLMNSKHLHTPVSTRARCPVCQQPVYSRAGIHPQCAVRQAELPRQKVKATKSSPESSTPIAGGTEAV